MKCDEMCVYKDCEDFQTFDRHFTEAYKKSDVDAAIAELKAENERLVKCCKEYDSRQRIDERIKFNGAQQLRATKRALWLARAERAVAEQTVDEWSRYKEKHPFGSWRADPFEYWVQAWIYVEKLCRKKAKEYK